MTTPKPADYFLSPQKARDDFAFLAPARRKASISSLIDGRATFRAIEGAIAGAKHAVRLAFWSFNPDMPVLSPAVRRSGPRRWSDLLIAAAKRGVDVRVFISDFDPVLYDHAHRRSWRAYRLLLVRGRRLSPDRLQVMCAPHEHVVIPNFAQQLIVVGPTYKKFTKEFNAHGRAWRRNAYSNSPGIWELFELSKKTGKVARKKTGKVTLLPATHHLKLAIVDDSVFTGGLNVSTGYIDTPRHTSKRRWHDIFVRADGDVAFDAHRSFMGLWNRELPGFERFVRNANALKVGFSLPVRKTTKLAAPKKPAKPRPAGRSIAQLQRTVSVKKASALIPTPLRTDVEQGYLQAIAKANEFIYIENQYVRAKLLADAIVKRYSQLNKKLRVVIVVPLFPEEAIGGKADPITQHGAHLQFEVLTKLRKALKGNLGLYSLVQKSYGRPRSKLKASFGSNYIYVHSKIFVVDDVFAAIGSANANPRGFRMDSELQVAWHGPNDAQRFRVKLWNELLGSPKGMTTWKPIDYVKRWDAIARKNARTTPRRRRGFVVPHDENLVKGQSIPGMPDEYAGLFESDPDLDPTRTA